jgi:hypothetical protein
MSIWIILGYLAVGYAVMLGVWWAGLRLHGYLETRRRIRDRLSQIARRP